MVIASEAPVRVLVVDDDEVYREVLRGAIEGEGLDISLAADGFEALERLRSEYFDLLISDLNMPGMDGLALLKNAREIHPGILTVIVTGYGSLESAIEAIRLGAYDYVQKPFKFEEMVVTARNAVEKIQILREKSFLLGEIQKLRRKLHLLGVAESSRGVIGEDLDQAERSHNGLPQQTLPLCLLEMPKEASNSVLKTLESLKDLRREGIISEFELQQIKKQILEKLNPGKS